MKLNKKLIPAIYFGFLFALPCSADTLRPVFSSIESNIFALKCLACHGAAHPAHGINLSDYTNVVTQPALPGLIVSGSPDSSILYKIVQQGLMPPNKAQSLTADELAAISQWITEGALNN